MNFRNFLSAGAAVIAAVGIALINMQEAVAEDKIPFVMRTFKVPTLLQTRTFKIRPLTAKYTLRDYEAVMTSRDRLQKMFLAEWDWPQNSMTIEDDRVDLGKEEQRFKERVSFAYTVLSLDESRVLGAVYFYPAKKAGFDANVTMWVRDSAFEKGLDPILFKAIKEWIAKDWPFKRVGYPGRDISWKDWNAWPSWFELTASTGRP